MINAIVLSKDRPAQLFLLLESLKRNATELFTRISVLYHRTDSSMDDGYEIVKKAFPSVLWVEQFNYRDDVMQLLDPTYHLTSFFTDDDIVYRDIDIDRAYIEDEFEANSQLACLSLRLGMNTVVQDPYNNIPTLAPESGFHYHGKLVYWRWNDVPAYMNFGYPLSVDGHLFRTATLLNICSKCKFNNPNQQEVTMQAFNSSLPPLMACLPESAVVNTPLNRVQDTCMNRAGEVHGMTPEYMLERFLAGEKLDLESVTTNRGIAIMGCHQELDIKWITR